MYKLYCRTWCNKTLKQQKRDFPTCNEQELSYRQGIAQHTVSA